MIEYLEFFSQTFLLLVVYISCTWLCARRPYLSILNTSIELQAEFVVFNFRGPFLLLFPFSMACIFLICLDRVIGRVLEESGGIAWYFH